jgi:hypothetical protein
MRVLIEPSRPLALAIAPSAKILWINIDHQRDDPFPPAPVLFHDLEARRGADDQDMLWRSLDLDPLQIKQDVRWLREREEGRQTADHDVMGENLAALGRSIERLKR